MLGEIHTNIKRAVDPYPKGRPTKFTLQFFVAFFGSAKTDLVRLKWGFGEGLLKDKSAFFEAYKSPIPLRRKSLRKKKAIFTSKKGPVKKPL